MNKPNDTTCDALFSQLPLEKKQVFIEVVAELDRAEKKFPSFPEDNVHRAAVVAEEAGELVRAALQHEYEVDRLDDMRKQAVQTAAMGVRFVLTNPVKQAAMVLVLFFWTVFVQAQPCQVGISTSCHSMCVPGTYKIDTAFCGWFVMTATGASSYTWHVSSGQILASPTITVYPGNPGVVNYTVTGTVLINNEPCTSQAVISITNVVCANGTPQWVGIPEVPLAPPFDSAQGDIKYYDVYGQRVYEPEAYKGQVLIEWVGKRRRKVVFY